MKKLFILYAVLATLTLLPAHAQYFQHVYGTVGGINVLSAGVNTNVLGLGHFMVGRSATTGTLLASRTNVNGDVPAAPFFDKEYTFLSSMVTTQVLQAKTVELANATGFGIAGTYYDPSEGRQSIFYAQMNPSGTVVSAVSYFPTTTSSTTFEPLYVAAIAPAAGNQLYITGSVQGNHSESYIYVIKIDLAGNIMWSRVYNIMNPGGNDSPADIIESPYQPANIPEVVVVGQTSGAGSKADAFLLRLSAATGIVLTNPLLYGTDNTWDYFSSISVANSMNGGSNGFIIGGGSDLRQQFSQDAWLIKADPTGTPLWQKLYDYNGASFSDNACVDVIERLNSNNNYEYYALGYTYNGNKGNLDMVVMKTDDAGNGVPLGQFTYGDASFDYPVSIDQNNSGMSDGLSMYGFQGNAGGPGVGTCDMYLVKAYFNGYSGCHEDFADLSPVNGPGVYNDLPAQLFTEFTTKPLTWRTRTANDVRICFNQTIMEGSNALVMPGRNEDPNVSVLASPNPGYQNLQTVRLDVESEAPADVQVALYDMVGREYYRGAFRLVRGQNTLSLDVSNASLTAGVYSVSITGMGKDRHTLLMIR